MSSSPKGTASAQEKNVSEIAGLTPSETKHLLLAYMCMTSPLKIDTKLLGTFTDTKAKSANWVFLKARRKLVKAYHETLADIKDKDETDGNQNDAKTQK
ncbi:hypothetical protein PENANT_c014G02610 [Penicillium antarcticum]|uniref:Uncharacterized protein n=1 Tax=Penicillium antarcticum TaxID=416450 RepID=A0A1V6Q495_9EURO|nr:uncharacterized protein N7508_009529 [Penicillium antarcticum]KAJ5294708.1 hypothetical protein N7508_009529 [Penicillium antarcticum]OQD84079.1 hypothetical protein PENANT_c014G02610 [Penicillium antarcticum]